MKSLRTNHKLIMSLAVVAIVFSVAAVFALANDGPFTVHGKVNRAAQGGFDKVVEVAMRGNRFHPFELEIETGTTVVWVNNDGDLHNVDFGPGPNNNVEQQMMGDMLRRNERYAMTFNEAGVYPYVCTPHAHMGMVAEIVVKEAQ